MFFAFSCALGLIFGCFIESVIFYISFAAIRKFAGGYHAATEARCEISSALSLLACVGVIRLSKIYDFRTALLCAAAVCAVLIFLLFLPAGHA
ncbi:MAG: accessory gene regulator B family protein [Anaerotruncus sp.]|nr:MAG: accessory gene regulator B family protein [Anaerotruncus sp.]